MRRGRRFGWVTGVVMALLVAVLGSLAPPPVGSSTAAAPVGVWTQVGPQGALVMSLAVDPRDTSIVYAGIAPLSPGPHLYRSTDGGQTWFAASSGLPTEGIVPTRLATAPSASGTVFLVDGAQGRLFRTQNGVNWKQVGAGSLAGQVLAVAVDPTTAAIVYAGTTVGAFKSTDGGDFWSPASTGLPAGAVSRLVVAPSAPLLVYALTPGGLYRSPDGAASWQAGSTQVTETATGFAVDASVPTTLYAGVSDSALRSTDGGGTWNPINAGLPSPLLMRALTADQTQSGVLYATTAESVVNAFPHTLPLPRFLVHRSVDGGTTWTPVHSGLSTTQVQTWLMSPAAAVARGGAAYVGGSQGVYASPNGTTWALRGLGLPRLRVLSVLVRPDGSVYAGTAEGGVWRSSNQGEEWLGPDGSLNGTNPTALAYDPSNPNVLYAATWDSRYRSGVKKSTDGGATWAPTGLETVRDYITANFAPQYDALAVHPAAPATVYAAGVVDTDFSSPGLSRFAPPPAIQVSTNGGTSWADRSMDAGPATSLALPPGASSTAFLGTLRGTYDPSIGQPPTLGKVWKTVNNGDPWQETNLTQPNEGVLALVLDPSAPNTLYAGTRGAKLLKTTDGGQTWAPASQGLPDGDVAALALDPTAPATVYAAVTGQGVFKSTNGGQGWALIAASGTPTAVRRLAVDPSKPSVLYAVDGGPFDQDGGRLVALDQALLPVTPTPTTVPTTCSPRPAIRVQTGQSGPGALTATVTATTSAGTPTNELQRISFDGGTNATVEVPGQPPRGPGFEYAPGGTTATFVVRRVNPGPFSVRLTVTDTCGPWQTFVGGGANVP